MTKNNNSDIVVVLDESSSMRDLEDDVIVCLNNFISTQKKVNDESNIKIWKFTHRAKLFVDCKLSDIDYVDDYTVKGTSSFYDTMYKAISHSSSNRRVSFLVISDGMDNASVQYNKKDVAKLISCMKKNMKWKFFYAGMEKIDYDEQDDNICCSQFSQTITSQKINKSMTQIESSVTIFRT